VDEALEELRKTCSQIYMTGLSMGGTLTLFTAASHADVIKGAIPINAVVHIGNPDMAGLAFGRGLPDTVPGIGSDMKDPDTKELAYAEVPVPAFRQVYALAAVTQDLLPRIKCPTLVITSREDHVVNPENGPRIVAGVGSNRAELVWLENSYHVATIDHDKALIAKLAIEFIRSIAGR
jgi:carboxylesterase